MGRPFGEERGTQNVCCKPCKNEDEEDGKEVMWIR